MKGTRRGGSAMLPSTEPLSPKYSYDDIMII
jgi:hypothetical protein